jgi:ferredoxin
MAKRKIIEIDREACNGCGLCTTACAEGALELDAENKAVLVRELFCDGMGACLDVCPTGALKIVERESEVYDPQATYAHVLKTRGKEAAAQVHGAGHGGAHSAGHAGAHGGADHGAPGAPAAFRGCPGSMACEIPADATSAEDKEGSAASQLSQWPIQLHLVSPFAPYFKNSDLLIAADCTAFALGSFHQDLLKGKKLAIACPKLDDKEGYIEKLAEIIRRNELKSLAVAVMTVPCCSGLLHIVRRAVEVSGVDIDVREVIVDIRGSIASDGLMAV